MTIRFVFPADDGAAAAVEGGSAPSRRALATERRYRVRADALIRAWRKEVPAERAASPVEFVLWLLRRGQDLRGPSFRQYKASALFAMRQHFPDSPELPLAMAELERASHRSAGPLPRRTSARKLKYISEADWRALSSYLRERDEEAGEGAPDWRVTSGLVEAWCRATLLCGLRPTEWSAASFDVEGDGGRLVVRNAKATHDRAHGETRTLLFERLAPEDARALRLVVAYARQWGAKGHAAALQKHVADRLYRAAKAALGARDAYPSLYTFRHQAIANWKTERSAVEVAALCGHRVIETAAKHYAGRSRAWRGRRPAMALPSIDDIQAVLAAHGDAMVPEADPTVTVGG